MKQLFSFLAVALLALGAMAQPKMPSFHFGAANKGYDYMMCTTATLLPSRTTN